MAKPLWAPWRPNYIQQAGERDGCVFCREATAALDDADWLVVHRGDHVFVMLNRFPGDTNFTPVLADVKVMPEHLLDTRDKLRAAWR